MKGKGVMVTVELICSWCGEKIENPEHAVVRMDLHSGYEPFHPLCYELSEVEEMYQNAEMVHVADMYL